MTSKAGSVARGEIVLEHASRSFSVRADQGSTLKDLLIGRRGGGPEPVQALRDVDLRIGPGGQDVVEIDGRTLLLSHGWDPALGYRRLYLDELCWVDIDSLAA